MHQIKTIHITIALILLLILRFMSNVYNLGVVTQFTVIGAYCLGAGYLWKRNALLAIGSLGLLLISDIAINTIVYKGEYGILSEGWWMSYFCFSAIMFLSNKLPVFDAYKNVLITSILSTLFFWLVSDFQYWYFIGTDLVTQEKLPLNISGYFVALGQGAPFVKNFFIGTFVYSTLMFMAFKWLPSLKLSHKTTLNY